MQVVEQQVIQTLEIEREEEIAAPIEIVFETILEQMGPYNETPETAMPMRLEAWPGGRWFRDLGNNNGHWWGNVQAIKAPKLLEISGPLFMSYPATSNVQYRLTEESGVTRLKFAHRAIGWIPDDIKDGVGRGWGHMLAKIRERSASAAGTSDGDRVSPSNVREVAPLRFEDRESMTLAGLKGHFLTGGDPAIASQWTHFAPHLGKVPGQVGPEAFGICWAGVAGGLDYMSAVEVRDDAEVPLELIEERLPTAKYAVFGHDGHVSEIAKTMHRALGWLGREGRETTQEPAVPVLIERYGKGFDPKTGKGNIELWIPVKS